MPRYSGARAADDDAASCRLAACGKFRIAAGEAVLGNGGNVGSERQDLCAGGHDVVGGDIVADLERTFCIDSFFKRSSSRERLDVRTSEDFNAVHILFINRFSALLFCIERCDNLALFELFFVRENIGQRNIIEFAQDSFLNGILQRKLKNYFSNFIQQEIISSLIVLTLWRSAQPEAISIRREPARKIFDKSIRTSSMYFVKNKQRIIAIIAR